MAKTSMKASLFALGFALTAGMFTGPAMAQSQAPELSFYPSQPWQTAHETSAAGLRDCFIESEFNNGFVLQFNGSDKWVQSLDIDFRQNVFTAGQDYDVAFSIPGRVNKKIKSRATDDSTVRVNLNGDKDFYKAAQTSAVLDVDVEGNTFRFYLVGFGQASESFEKCMAGAPAPTPMGEVRQADAAQSKVNETIAMEAKEKAKTGSALKTADKASPSTPTPLPGAVKTPTPMPKSGMTDVSKVEPASANTAKAKGANPSVLERKVAMLEAENQALEEDLEEAMRKAEDERFSLSTENWNLERATMQFNEAERQLDRLGKQIARERAQCTVEKQELESMLFDPQVTSQQQMAKLADLERQLDRAEQEREELRIRYEARIRILEEQLGTH